MDDDEGRNSGELECNNSRALFISRTTGNALIVPLCVNFLLVLNTRVRVSSAAASAVVVVVVVVLSPACERIRVYDALLFAKLRRTSKGVGGAGEPAIR